MKKIIVGTIIALMLPVSALAYGLPHGGGGGYMIRRPLTHTTQQQYQDNLKKRILELRVKLLKLQLELLRRQHGEN